MVVLHDPGGLGKPVDTLWAWVVIHGDGDEALAATFIPGIGPGVLVFAKESTALALKPVAQQLATLSNKRLVLQTFTPTAIVDEVMPK